MLDNEVGLLNDILSRITFHHIFNNYQTLKPHGSSPNNLNEEQQNKFFPYVFYVIGMCHL